MKIELYSHDLREYIKSDAVINYDNEEVRGLAGMLFEKAADKMTNSAMNTIGRKIGNSIFNLFK